MLADMEAGTAPGGALVSVADGALETGFAADRIPSELLGPGATLASTPGFASFDSRSATRFSNCSTRSSSHRSRSVSPASGLLSDAGLTVADVVNLYTVDAKNQDLLRRATQSSALPESWRDYFRKRLWEPDA